MDTSKFSKPQLVTQLQICQRKYKLLCTYLYEKTCTGKEKKEHQRDTIPEENCPSQITTYHLTKSAEAHDRCSHERKQSLSEVGC